MPGVDICLATYNGACHLPELLSSLRAQSTRDWRLLVRDDGSRDGSLRLTERFARQESRVELLPPGAAPLGPKGNFATLLAHSQAPYVFLADQDDVWLPEKLQLSLARLQQLEDRVGSGVPLLVHSDVRVVDARLRLVAPSLWAHLGVTPRWAHSVRRLAVQNIAPGCSIAVNRALLEQLGGIPRAALFHDWWLMLFACARGLIGAVDTPTMLYRQHDGNVVGAERLSVPRLLHLSLKFRLSGWSASKGPMKQAAALLTRCGPWLTPEDRTFLERFARLRDLAAAERLLGCLRLGVRQRNPRETAWFYLAI